MEGLSHVRQSVRRVDGLEKVTGQAKYTNDFSLPRMVYGRVLRSPYPYARIAAIDASRAGTLPGVRAVLTGKDVPEGRMGVIQDRPLLAVGEVRFVGEPVALVGADTPDIAEEALDLIEVEYQELPAVFDVEMAMAPRPGVVVQPGHAALPGMASYAGQPFYQKAGEDLPNVYRHFHLGDGDIERGLRESDVVVENRYVVGRTQHCAMEPHCAIARHDPDGGFTVWASEQHPYEAQSFLSRIFRLPPAKVRVIVPYIGGGFGGKLFVMASPWAMLLAQKTGRPAKVVYSREEVFVDGLTDVSMVIYIKDGVKTDGRLWARQVKAVLNCGAYSGRVLVINDFLPLTATVNYRIPHFCWDSYCVATNEPVSGPLRGFGGVQLIFAIETQMDILARSIGMDPYRFRRQNLYQEGERNLLSQATYASEAHECLDRVAQWLDWDKKPGKTLEGPWRVGRGVAAQAKGGLVGLYSLVDVKVHADATIEVRHSATEVGQGCHTVLAQIAAEEFRTSLDKVRQMSADTAVTPHDITSTADLTTFNTGNSLRRACQDAKRQILELAAERLKLKPDGLELRDGLVYSRGRFEPLLKLGDLFVPGGGGTARRGEVIGHGLYAGRTLSPEERARRLETFGVDYTECFGACAAEVAVNVETGEVKVLRLAQCHDMGTPVNPLACEAQMDGGTGFGIGRALYEDIVIENGVTVNPNFVDYKLPSIMEVPLEGKAGSLLPAGIPHKDGPYGARGFGESTSCDVSPAIANAVCDAVGIRVFDLPLTRERVLEALKRAG